MNTGLCITLSRVLHLLQAITRAYEKTEEVDLGELFHPNPRLRVLAAQEAEQSGAEEPHNLTRSY